MTRQESSKPALIVGMFFAGPASGIALSTRFRFDSLPDECWRLPG